VSFLKINCALSELKEISFHFLKGGSFLLLPHLLIFSWPHGASFSLDISNIVSVGVAASSGGGLVAHRCEGGS
jgi:hypothetical protein